MQQYHDHPNRTRLDKWLWAARFFKTRSLATDAVNGGKIQVNGEHAKPSKDVKIGDEVRVQIGPFTHVILVRAIGERRGSAAAAAALFEETPESIAERERRRDQLRLAPTPAYDDRGRPTKKDRRNLTDFVDRNRRSR